RLRPPPTLRPYTTLFRSGLRRRPRRLLAGEEVAPLGDVPPDADDADDVAGGVAVRALGGEIGARAGGGGDDVLERPGAPRGHDRSEEHASELQSPDHLVC